MTNRFNQQQQQDSNPERTKFLGEVVNCPKDENLRFLKYLRKGLEGQNETLLINIAYLMGLHRSYIESPEEPTQQRDKLLELKRNGANNDTLKQELLAIAKNQEEASATIENLADASISYIFMILNQESWIDGLANKIENRG